MEKTMPETFPLDNGKLSCLTCHDVLPQMKADFVLKSMNRKFVRGAPYEVLSRFCFYCHKQEEYKKTNPHQQLDDRGRIVDDRCLFCHQSVPDPLQVKHISDVSFKTSLSQYCVNCHFQQKTGHPARADHLKALPDFLESLVPERARAQHAELPLDGDRIFCGTCHNPHQKGVIQRREAAAGAGEEYFLRINGGYQLCITCHMDKELKEAEGAPRVSEGPPGLPQELLSTHKPVKENQCKRCHAITAENREQPRALSLCFKTDCHKTEMLNQEYVHEVTVIENCYLCHSPHSSTYEKLLRQDKGKLCRSCHPLMRDRTGRLSAGIGQGGADAGTIGHKDAPSPVAAQKGISKGAFEKSSKEHAAFTQFIRSTSIPPGRECGFCHSPDHKRELGTVAMDVCSRCHTFVRDTLAGKSKAPLNIHDTFQDKACTACHDPHAAPYQHVLKEPAEHYLPREQKVPQLSSRPPEMAY
jgi:predicted CXXCH cytochrome family protein